MAKAMYMENTNSRGRTGKKPARRKNGCAGGRGEFQGALAALALGGYEFYVGVSDLSEMGLA